MSSGPPTISIVTPSFNQARFLEEAIRSIAEQDYPHVEHVIMDGGSTDGSVEIIRRHADRLAYWTSGTDRGQYDAINRGFEHTSGEVMAWLNADDKYTPWALGIVGDVFASCPEVEWITTLCPLFWDERGRAVKCSSCDGYSRRGFLRGEHLPGGGWYARSFIQQESTFWRRSLWERAGGRLDTNYGLAADFELWARFYQHAELCGVPTPLGGFRRHADQKTAHHMEQYVAEAEQILRRYGGRPYGRFESLLRSRLLRHLPRGLRGAARRLRLLHPTNVCVRDGTDEAWQVAAV